MAASLDGRHIVVTGGAGALGSAVVEAALALGAICHVPAYNAAERERFALRDHERVHVSADVDLTDEAAVGAFYGALPHLWASLNVAGGFSMAPLTETTADAFRAQLEMNAVTCFLACREAARAIRKSGDGGRIVNVAARPALMPTGGMVAYTTSKAAVVSLTRCLAAELHGEGILVNAVAPSVMNTPDNCAAMPDADQSRWPTVADVAAAMLHLATPQMHLTTGLVVPVYGDA